MKGLSLEKAWHDWWPLTKLLVLALLLWIDRWFQDHWFRGSWETISGHLGKMQVEFGGSIPWRRRPLQAAVSRFLDWLDKDHCKKSIGF